MINDVKLTFSEVLDYPECPEIILEKGDLSVYIDMCVIHEENEEIVKTPIIFVFVPLKLLEDISNKLAKELEVDPIINTKSLYLSESIRLLQNPD